MDTIIFCGSNLIIEKKFQGEYNHVKFKVVRITFRSKMNYVASLYIMEDRFAIYHVLEEVSIGVRSKERVLIHTKIHYLIVLTSLIT